MTLDQVRESYETLIEGESVKVSWLRKRIFKIGSLRLAVVLLCITLSYILWGNTSVVLSMIGLSVILFVVLLKFHNSLHLKKKYSELLTQNAKNELKGLDYDFSPFDGARERNDATHSFSYDLDMFGDKSFFQSINRTVTKYGADNLGHALCHPFLQKQEIEHQQIAVQKMCESVTIAQRFRAIGQMNDVMEPVDIKELVGEFAQTSLTEPYSRSPLWRLMPYIMPVLSLGSIAMLAFDVIPSTTFIVLWVIWIGVSSIPMKKQKKMMGVWDKSTESLQTYSRLLKVVEDYDGNHQVKGSEAIAQLSRHVENFYQTFTIPGIFFLCPILMWNIKYNIRIEQWIEKHRENIGLWFDRLGEFDSLVSQGIYAYNHPDYIYPRVSEQFRFVAKDLGHPMLRRSACVRNDVTIAEHPFFLVVTGANMAGKSTYLRTVGLNLTLASAGLPVFATSLEFYPFRLVTNLRTSDSLADSESYFFAELKRLKMIIDRLQAGEQLFIILDEILKGTNSEDKQKGSIALMKQLIAESGCGIIATHDLLLGELESEFPKAVKNYRFEADITNENLSFTYRIREGVAQNMNACFLMKKMGITGL